MSPGGDVLCPRRARFRAPGLAGVLLRGQAVPERVGGGDTGGTGGRGGGGQRAGVRTGPTGKLVITIISFYLSKL